MIGRDLMEKSRSKYLIKNTIIFTIGNLGSKLISFLLIPLYTNVLTTSQYGVVDLISTICTVLVPLITLNICEAVMRFCLDSDANKEAITKIGTIIFAVAMVVGILIIPACGMYPPISDYAVYVYFYVVTLAASQLYLCVLRGNEQLLQYSLGNILQTLFIAIFNIVFLLFMQTGTKGYLLAYILANLLVALYAFIVGNCYKSLRVPNIEKSQVIAMVKYSVVLIPNSFMWWIINASDRVMVTILISASANGIYAISYKIPTLVSTLTSIFNQAWSYSAIREEGAKDEAEYNNKVFKMLTGGVMLVGIGILAFIKPFLKIYVTEDYYEAWKYVPFLVVGSIYLTLGTFMATSYTVHKDSFGYLFSATFGAGFKIILNLLLIPMISVYGAAVATCVSYIAVFVFRYFHTRKYIKYNIANKEFVVGSVFMMLSACFMFLDNIWGQIIQIGIGIGAICLYVHVWLPIIKKLLGNSGFRINRKTQI